MRHVNLNNIFSTNNIRVSEYRADIDGLRAVAVLSVLLFHVGFSTFTGGFVGVDVFFVISGFLITRLIIVEKNQDKFSFSTFYVRRIRRLFPALCFTLIMSFVVAFFLLSPQYMERFSLASIFTFFSLSNMFFWSETGYFDAESLFKPLLHTWSLGIEEQFYLLWPVPLVFFLRKNNNWLIPGVLVCLFTISLLLNFAFLNGAPQFLSDRFPLFGDWFSDGRATIFYLLPFRVFEFTIGAVMVWLTPYQQKYQWVKELFLLVGLSMILFSVFSFTENLLYPSHYALLPCIGTALVIYAGQAKFLGFLLRNKLTVGIGLISYSLYLVHWPLIVFTKYYAFDDISVLNMYQLCVASIIIAIFMYFFVEQPFRGKSKARFALNLKTSSFLTGCLAIVILISGASFHSWLNDGWKWRTISQDNIFSTIDLDAESKKRVAVLNDLCENNKTVRKGCIDNKRQNGLIVGNSHAIDGLNIMHAIYGDKHSYLLSGVGGCPPFYPEILEKRIDKSRKKYHICKGLNDWRYSEGFYNEIDYVVISVMYSKTMFTPDDLKDYIKYLNDEGVDKIIVLGSHYKMKKEIYEIGRQGDYMSIQQLIENFVNSKFQFNSELKQVCEEFDCLFIDKKELLCDKNGNSCVVSIRGKPFSLDKGHLTADFSQYLGEKSSAIVKEYLSDLK